ncbi:MAG: hypothetical protein ACK5GO_07165 [Ignavibacteria bacterium]|jgi:hypothetical protein
MVREFHFDKRFIIAWFVSVMVIIGTFSSCTPVNDVSADRTRTIVDSVTKDSLHRSALILSPTSLAFETEYPSKEIVKSIVFANGSDSLFIPIDSIRLKHGNQGFSLTSDSIHFVLTPKTQLGYSKSIPIRFNPKSEGQFKDTLLINGWKNVFIPLTAMVLSGTRVWIEDVDFGSIPFGEVRDTVIRLYNYGTETAIISSIEFTDGDIDQFELLSKLRFPYALQPGTSISIPLRSKSSAQGLNINAQISADISYSGKGRVKHKAMCSSSVFLKSGIYVTDIRMFPASINVPFDAICTFVNNTSGSCSIIQSKQSFDNPSCTALFIEVFTPKTLNKNSSISCAIRITPKRKGAFSMDIPFTIVGDSIVDDVCTVIGIAQ